MRKRNVVLTAVPFALAGVIAASAYISQTVNASQTGSTATPQPISAKVTDVPTNFAPGSPEATVNLHITNPNQFPVQLSGLQFRVTAPGISKCPEGSFTVTAPSSADIPKDSADTVVPAKLKFNITGDNQNGCLGEALTVTASAT